MLGKMVAKSLAISTAPGVASLIIAGICGMWAMNVALSAIQFRTAALSRTNGPLAEEKVLISILSLFRNILLNTK